MAVPQPGGLRSKVRVIIITKIISVKKLLNFTRNDEMGMSL